MSISHHEQHQLYRIESGLLRSDPRLGAKLATFAKLSAGQRLPSWEHVATRQDRIRQAAVLAGQAIAVIVAALRVLASAVVALFAAIIMGRRARPLQPARPQDGPGIGGRADRANSS
jgi:hypothetical protein